MPVGESTKEEAVGMVFWLRNPVGTHLRADRSERQHLLITAPNLADCQEDWPDFGKGNTEYLP